MAKPWQSKAWRKKREEFIKGKSCEWCKSEKNLVIHHPKHFNGLREYKKSIASFMREYFSNPKNQEERQELWTRASKEVSQTYSYFCSYCGYSIYARKSMRPKYKCRKCGAETDKPIRKVSSQTRYLLRKKFRFLFSQRYKKEIDRLYAQTKDASDKEYLSFKSVMVLCKRCHFAKEKGLVLCEICRRSYHRPKYGKCWECFKKTEGGQRRVRVLSSG